MYVIEQAPPVPTPLPGIAHATWAGHDQGLSQVSMWRQTLAPGAASPPHRHDCDEVVLCLAGCGELHAGGRVHRFGPNATVVLPKEQDHQLFNTGSGPLELIAVFGATPVHTVLPDGAPIDLPWPT
jgi:mannose-6-phosphate isomerase-like protein (cupin superfamily)